MGIWNTKFGGDLFEGGLPPDFVDQWEPHTTITQTDAAGDNFVGKYYLGLHDTASERRLLRWVRAEADDLTDTHHLALYRPTETPFGSHFGFWARASGAIGSEDAYWCRVRQSPNAELHIDELSGGVNTNVANDLNVLGGADFLINTWYWLEFRVQGTSLKARVWAEGDTVPNWQLDTTDGTHTAAGFAGFGGLNQQFIQVDWYSLGTEGFNAQFFNLDPAAPDTINTLIAIPSSVQLDGTSFLVYTGEPNVAVDWTLTGDGTLTVLTDQTDGAGKAWARYTPGTLGSHNVDVEVGIPV